ncbi:hypothetical protein Tco_0522804 [Tanacetum coccineum]
MPRRMFYGVTTSVRLRRNDESSQGLKLRNNDEVSLIWFIEFVVRAAAENHRDTYNGVLMPNVDQNFRLHARLQECNGDEVLEAQAGAKVQKFTELALKCFKGRRK